MVPCSITPSSSGFCGTPRRAGIIFSLQKDSWSSRLHFDQDWGSRLWFFLYTVMSFVVGVLWFWRSLMAQSVDLPLAVGWGGNIGGDTLRHESSELLSCALWGNCFRISLSIKQAFVERFTDHGILFGIWKWRKQKGIDSFSPSNLRCARTGFWSRHCGISGVSP